MDGGTRRGGPRQAEGRRLKGVDARHGKDGGMTFPFGVGPEEADDTAAARQDDRGPDTINRLLLHGARYHDREAAFLHWGQDRTGWTWQETPDWRADRGAVRVALVFREKIGVAAGSAVALWLPLGPEWAVIERGVWLAGGVSVPIWPEWEPERVARVLDDARPEVLFAPELDAVESLRVLDGVPPSVQVVVPLRAPDEKGEDWLSYDKLLEYGGVQDTPERASMLRTSAREVAPGTVATYEYGGAGGTGHGGAGGSGGRTGRRELDQGALAEVATRVARRFPPRPGRVQLLAGDRPDLLSRVLLFAGWADGVTTTAFARTRAGHERAGELEPELVACDGEVAPALLASLPARGEAAGPTPREALVRWLRELRGRRDEAPRAPDGPAFLIRGGMTAQEARESVERAAGPEVRLLDAAELESRLVGFDGDGRARRELLSR